MLETKTARLTCISLSILLWVGGALSQPVYYGKATSMMGANVLQMRCSQAAGWNPANLCFGTQPKWTATVGSFGVMAGNNSLTYSTMGDILQSGHVISDNEKQMIFDKIGKDNLTAFGNTIVTLAGVTYDSYGINFDLHAQGKVELPPDVVDFFLNGAQMDRWYRFDDVKLEGSSYLASSVSAAFPLYPPKFLTYLSFGGTFKLLTGQGFYGLTGTSGQVYITHDRMDNYGNFAISHSASGLGLGLDFGLMGESEPLRMAFGLTIGNLFGYLDWSDVTVDHYDFYLPPNINPDEARNRDYWNQFLTKSTVSGQTLTQPLPHYLLFSYRYSLPSLPVVAYGSYYQGLNRTAEQNLVPRLAVGGEWQGFTMFPVRGGMSFGGMEAFALSAGTGWAYKKYRLDFGFAWQEGFLNYSHGYSMGLTNYFVF